MHIPPEVPNGIPVVVAGIPTVQDEQGIVSPFPYLNPDSEEWNGEDEEGFDEGGSAFALIDPDEPEDGGGEYGDEEYDDEDDDIDTGFGVGIGLFGGFFAPPPLLPA